jgi:hypothetical protein
MYGASGLSLWAVEMKYKEMRRRKYNAKYAAEASVKRLLFCRQRGVSSIKLIINNAALWYLSQHCHQINRHRAEMLLNKLIEK